MSTVQYNKTVLVSLALVMVAVILPVEAIRTWDDWNNGQDGIKWLYNCEFPGSWTLEAKEYNNDYMPMEESQCGRACIDRRGCNSFVYREAEERNRPGESAIHWTELMANGELDQRSKRALFLNLINAQQAKAEENIRRRKDFFKVLVAATGTATTIDEREFDDSHSALTP